MMGDIYKTFGLPPPAPGSLMGNAVLYTPKEKEWMMGKLQEIKNAIVPQSIQQQYAAYKEDPVKALAKPPQDTSDLIGQLAATMPIAFHGSPYKFEKFSAEKIGTGQGAQTYGHGLYFAENPEVAKSYATMNIPGGTKPGAMENLVQIGNFQVPSNLPFGKESSGYEYAANAFTKFQGDIDKAIDYMTKTAKSQQAKNAIDILKNEKISFSSGPNLYKVNIPDEHVAKMLDFDKPLNEQAPEIVKKLEDFYRKPISKIGKSVSDLPIDNPTGTKWLSDLGIPGIKYLDQGSRPLGNVTQNAETGKWFVPTVARAFNTKAEAMKELDKVGTRNFVIFDPEIIKDVQKQ